MANRPIVSELTFLHYCVVGSISSSFFFSVFYSSSNTIFLADLSSSTDRQSDYFHSHIKLEIIIQFLRNSAMRARYPMFCNIYAARQHCKSCLQLRHASLYKNNSWKKNNKTVSLPKLHSSSNLCAVKQDSLLW